MTQTTLLYPDGSVAGEYAGRREALAAARRILGVSRLVHDDQRRPTGGGTYWLHESRELECGSLELVVRAGDTY